MDVKLIKRQLKNGMTSLVLEFYYGYSLSINGTVRPKRKFETLEYFLYSSPRNKLEREHNRINMRMAEKVRGKRLLEQQNEKYGFMPPNLMHHNFIDYMGSLVEQRKDSPGNYGNWKSAMKHLIYYAGNNVPFYSVNKSFVEGFKRYLTKEAVTKNGAPLATGSQGSYFIKFKATLNQAVMDGILVSSPAIPIKGIQVLDVEREYLTFDELKRLVKTDCRNKTLKRAFIFSCLTGMRWSDVSKLVWSEVQCIDSATRIVFRQKKTKGFEYLDIADQAVDYMGRRGEPVNRVFDGLSYSTWCNKILRAWCLDAGIQKNITFHCARHTFAVIQLTLGTEIYTVSKLLGHRELKTTQIYAHIIDNKKREAVNRIPIL